MFLKCLAKTDLNTSFHRFETVNYVFHCSYTPDVGAHKIHTDAITWNEARSLCKNEGGDLAVINSPTEARLLKGFFQNTQSFVIGSSDSSNIHIGYFDPQRIRKFITVDGKPLEDSGYAVWRSGEPNNWIGSGEYCGAMHIEGTLNDIQCDVRAGFICELPHA